MEHLSLSPIENAQLSVQDMLNHGLHLGHLSRFWNPKMAPFIHKVRYGVHIINLVKTERYFKRALSFMEKIVAKGGKILFLGTKARASDLVALHSERCGMPYVNHRWLGGMLTNFKTVKQSISRLSKLQEMAQSGVLDKLTKKEALMKAREIEKLEKTLGGIKKLNRLPDALFVIDVGYEDTAVKEANKLGIPVIGLVDTNNSPDGIQYVIPSNDDAIVSINYVLSLVSQSIEKVKAEHAEQNKIEAKSLAKDPVSDKKTAPKKEHAKTAVKTTAKTESVVEPKAPVAASVEKTEASVTVSAADVKKLRDVTEAAMMDCKKALVQAGGDFEKAKEILIQSSQKKVAKAATRIASEGVIQVIAKGESVAFVEINCETDFVARDQNFILLQQSVEKAFSQDKQTVEALLATEVDGLALSEHVALATAKLGEKIQIRRLVVQSTNDKTAYYNHGGKIATFVQVSKADAGLARDLAMHIAAMNPRFNDLKDVPADVMKAQEAEIIAQLAEEGEKTDKIKKTILKGRLEKHFAPQCLMSQEFIKQPDLTIAALLASKDLTIEAYIRMELGEGIEKEEIDFAEEVKKQADKA